MSLKKRSDIHFCKTQKKITIKSVDERMKEQSPEQEFMIARIGTQLYIVHATDTFFKFEL